MRCFHNEYVAHTAATVNGKKSIAPGEMALYESRIHIIVIE
jgi:hypothetical protein